MVYHMRVTVQDVYDPVFRSDYRAIYDVSLDAVEDRAAIDEAEGRRLDLEKGQPSGRTVSIEVFKKIA